MHRCKGVTKKRKPCRLWAERTYCRFHKNHAAKSKSAKRHRARQPNNVASSEENPTYYDDYGIPSAIPVDTPLFADLVPGDRSGPVDLGERRRLETQARRVLPFDPYAEPEAEEGYDPVAAEQERKNRERTQKRRKNESDRSMALSNATPGPDTSGRVPIPLQRRPRVTPEEEAAREKALEEKRAKATVARKRKQEEVLQKEAKLFRDDPEGYLRRVELKKEELKLNRTIADSFARQPRPGFGDLPRDPFMLDETVDHRGRPIKPARPVSLAELSRPAKR
eukprot:jgi/Mesvir1/5636/Mv15654-RA.1